MQPGFFQIGEVLAKKGTIFVSSFCKQKIRFYAVYSTHIGLFRQCQCISIIDNFFKFWAIYIFLDKRKKQVFNVIITYRCHHGWHRENFCIFDYKSCLENAFLKHSSHMFTQYILDFVARIRAQLV